MSKSHSIPTVKKASPNQMGPLAPVTTPPKTSRCWWWWRLMLVLLTTGSIQLTSTSSSSDLSPRQQQNTPNTPNIQAPTATPASSLKLPSETLPSSNHKPAFSPFRSSDAVVVGAHQEPAAGPSTWPRSFQSLQPASLAAAAASSYTNNRRRAVVANPLPPPPSQPPADSPPHHQQQLPQLPPGYRQLNPQGKIQNVDNYSSQPALYVPPPSSSSSSSSSMVTQRQQQQQQQQQQVAPRQLQPALGTADVVASGGAAAVAPTAFQNNNNNNNNNNNYNHNYNLYPNRSPLADDQPHQARSYDGHAATASSTNEVNKLSGSGGEGAHLSLKCPKRSLGTILRNAKNMLTRGFASIEQRTGGSGGLMFGSGLLAATIPLVALALPNNNNNNGGGGGGFWANLLATASNGGIQGRVESVMGWIERSVEHLPSFPRLHPQECVKRSICEAHNEPNKYGAIGFMIRFLFPASNLSSTDRMDNMEYKVINKYRHAASFGFTKRMDGENGTNIGACKEKYEDCLVSLLDVAQNLVDLFLK